MLTRTSSLDRRTRRSALVRRAVDKAEQLGISGAIAVVGASGALVTASRMDEGGAGGLGRARSKAWIAATQKIPSHRAPAPDDVDRARRSRPASRRSRRRRRSRAPAACRSVTSGPDHRRRSPPRGRRVSPFFPAELDRRYSIVDGQPANPEDQVIAYALDMPYVGQHGDDKPRWEARYGAWQDRSTRRRLGPVPSRQRSAGARPRGRARRPGARHRAAGRRRGGGPPRRGGARGGGGRRTRRPRRTSPRGSPRRPPSSAGPAATQPTSSPPPGTCCRSRWSRLAGGVPAARTGAPLGVAGRAPRGLRAARRRGARRDPRSASSAAARSGRCTPRTWPASTTSRCGRSTPGPTTSPRSTSTGCG